MTKWETQRLGSVVSALEDAAEEMRNLIEQVQPLDKELVDAQMTIDELRGELETARKESV